MNLEDIKIGLTRYKIDDFQLIVPGYENFPIENQFISGIQLEKDYDDFLFPFFQMQIGIPGWLYRGMKKNPYDCKAQFSMKKGQHYSQHISAHDTTMYTKFISGRFSVYIGDVTPDVREEERTNLDKEREVYDKGYNYSDMTYIPILLYNEEYLASSRKIVNKVLSSATLTEAITLVCNQTGISNVLMSLPQNSSKYKELVLTPIPAGKQLERLANEFGLHTKGTIVFFDFDKLYIIDKDPKCTAFVKNEYKTTYLCSFVKSGKDTMLADGCYSDSKEKYNLLNIHENSIKITNASTINQGIYGNNYVHIDSVTGAVSNNSTQETKDGTASPARVVISKDGNNTTSALSYALTEASYIVYCSFLYIDLDMVTPNKVFVLNVEESALQKYNKEYRLKKMTCLFQQEGNYWVPHVTLELRG